MKAWHPVFQCIALTLALACSDTGSDDETALGSASNDESSIEETPEQPATDVHPAPSPTTRDKFVCVSGCTKISTAAPSPMCCHCNGADRFWQRSTWSAVTWLCTAPLPH